jgi:SAM-dependent methyltransferase
MDADAWDRRYAESELVWGAAPNRFVKAELSALPAGRALDLACGEGRNAIWLATRGWQVTAVDFSPAAIDKGRRLAERAGAAVAWRVADVLAYEPPPEGFDAVLVTYLHVPPTELERIWAIATRAVAVGGTLLIVGHDRTNLTEGLGGPQDPALLYDLEVIAGSLTGLRVERAERIRRPVPTASGTRDAIDTLVRATRP